MLVNFRDQRLINSNVSFIKISMFTVAEVTKLKMDQILTSYNQFEPNIYKKKKKQFFLLENEIVSMSIINKTIYFCKYRKVKITSPLFCNTILKHFNSTVR